MSETGRRSATKRTSLNSTAVLGALLVVLTIGALLLVRPHVPTDPSRPPEETRLTSASLGCPASAGADAAYLSTGRPSGQGEVRVGSAGDRRSVTVRSGQVTELPEAPDALVVEAAGEMAPGLLASRFGGPDVAAVDCPAPTPETWFTGVGAGARHNSVLELVNPDDGPAVADVAVYSGRGQLDVPRLRGVTVSGHDTVRLDLGEAIPKRGELALHVVVSRGRLASALLDEIPSIGTTRTTRDWLAGQPEPATHHTLLGLAPGPGSDHLAVMNPGEDEARVTVKVLTEDSAFAPEGVEEIRVPPASLRRVSLKKVLRTAIKDGAVGLEVSSTVPVTAGLRSLVAEDLTHADPVLPLDGETTALVPPGTASLLLADAGSVGVVTVTSWTAQGKRAKPQRVEVRPGSGATVDLPRGTALVTVAPARTSVHAAVVVTGPGATVVGLRELVTAALVPDVRPGQP